MAWILGIERLFGSTPFLAGSVLVVASACSTDVEYLRAGNIAIGAGGGEPAGAGIGGGGAAGSSTDDAGGGGAEPDASDDLAPVGVGGSSSVGGSGGGGAGGEARDAATDAGLRPPKGVQLGVPTPSDSISPSPGGMNYTDVCTGGVVIGVQGTVDAPGTGLNYLKSVAVVCGTLGVTGTGPFQVTTTLVGPKMPRGDMPGTVTQQALCPANQVVVGFDSRAAMYIDQLTFRCAPVTVVARTDSYALSIGMSKQIGSVGGSGGNLQSTVLCENDALAVGSVLRAGNAIDAFGFACASASLAFGP
jgi:hypothetical protein